MRDLELPRGAQGAREGRHVREARRPGGGARQRRRARHVHAGRGRAGRRTACELLRPRRRRAARRGRPARDHQRGPRVESILFNIFGGITRCDEVARGILQALRRLTDRGDRRATGHQCRGGRAPTGAAGEPPAVELTCSRQRSAPWSWRRELERPRPAYRDSEAHRRARTSTWSSSGPKARKRRSTSPRAGHVARRLRESGLNVVTVDSAPGMQPDVVSRGEELPFADGSFDVVAVASRRTTSTTLRRPCPKWPE